jgi:hypothetical protein
VLEATTTVLVWFVGRLNDTIESHPFIHLARSQRRPFTGRRNSPAGESEKDNHVLYLANMGRSTAATHVRQGRGNFLVWHVPGSGRGQLRVPRGW